MNPSRQRIVLVEDNPGDALLACEYLAETPSGAPLVDVAPTLAQATRLLQSTHVDAIVLDLNLPDSQGLETLRSIKAVAGSAPIIVVSGHVDETLREAALLAGAEDVFDKRETHSRLFSRSVLYVVERNRARGQQAQLQALLDATPDAIVVVDDRGTLLFANAAAVDLLGVRHEILEAGDSVFAAEGGEPVEMLLECRGQPVTCEVRITALDWGGQPARVASIRDMTMRNQSEQLKLRSAELEVQNLQIREASRLKSEFLANMSHEIRTPMNAVIGLSYLLERTVLDSAQAGHVAKIKVASKALLGIISNVLDVSKIEAGELSIERAPFNLERVLQDLSALIAVQASAKGVDFVVEVDSSAPKTLEGDATRLHQVLTNLLANAVKFTSQGVVRLDVQTLHATDKEVRLRFVVSDSGIGIAPEAMARLFNPFVQADASTTRRFGGTGLGLSIVKQLVELMGGIVEVSSEPGVGSKFMVELDLPISEYTALADHYDPEMPPTGGRLAGLRLLVVDDSNINLEVAQRILELEGAAVWLAGNGQEAVDYLLAMPSAIDVVLMDVQMPVLDGHDATRRIRNGLGLHDLPIIALTAGALTSERHLSVAAGMTDFVSKPFDPDTLVGCISRHVGGVKAAAKPARPLAPAPTDWPTIEGIDSADVSRRMGGDLHLFKSLLRMMFATFADGDVAGRSGADISARLHELKGTAGTLGAKIIAAMAADAEDASRTGRTDRTRALSKQIAQKLRELQANTASLLAAPKSPTEAHSTDTTALDREALARLIHLLRTDNLAAGDIFSSIAPQLRRVLGAETVETLEAQIDALDFGSAAELLECSHLVAQSNDVATAH